MINESDSKRYTNYEFFEEKNHGKTSKHTNLQSQAHYDENKKNPKNKI